MSSLRRTVNEVLSDPAAFQDPEKLKEFDAYFQGFVFPVMTNYQTEKQLGAIGRGRQSFLTRYLWKAEHPAVHKHLTSMTLEQMKTVATGDFHPVARYNAVLILGRLDEQPADDRADRPPVPRPEAADVMLDLLEADPSKTPDTVVLGAILGLLRHAQYGLSADRAKRLIDAAVTIASSERPAARSAEGHAWIQWRAAEVLASVARLGEHPRAHEALLALIADSGRPLSKRCREAELLGQLKEQYAAGAGIDGAATAAALVSLAKDIAKAEQEEAEKYIELKRTSGAFTVTGEEIEYPRRSTLDRVNCILTALDAAGPVVPEEAKEHLKAIHDALDAAKNLVTDKKEIDLALARGIDERFAPAIFAAADLLAPGEEAEEVPDIP